MSLGKFITKYSGELNTILGVLLPLVENSNIFTAEKQVLRQMLEDMKDNVASLNTWLEKHGLEAAETPIVIRQSDIDAAVRRYQEANRTNDQKELEALLDARLKAYTPVNSAGPTVGPTDTVTAAERDHPSGTEATETGREGGDAVT